MWEYDEIIITSLNSTDLEYKLNLKYEILKLKMIRNFIHQ